MNAVKLLILKLSCSFAAVVTLTNTAGTYGAIQQFQVDSPRQFDFRLPLNLTNASANSVWVTFDEQTSEWLIVDSFQSRVIKDTAVYSFRYENGNIIRGRDLKVSHCDRLIPIPATSLFAGFCDRGIHAFKKQGAEFRKRASLIIDDFNADNRGTRKRELWPQSSVTSSLFSFKDLVACHAPRFNDPSEILLFKTDMDGQLHLAGRVNSKSNHDINAWESHFVEPFDFAPVHFGQCFSEPAIFYLVGSSRRPSLFKLLDYDENSEIPTWREFGGFDLEIPLGSEIRDQNSESLPGIEVDRETKRIFSAAIQQMPSPDDTTTVDRSLLRVVAWRVDDGKCVFSQQFQMNRSSDHKPVLFFIDETHLAIAANRNIFVFCVSDERTFLKRAVRRDSGKYNFMTNAGLIGNFVWTTTSLMPTLQENRQEYTLRFELFPIELLISDEFNQ